MSGVDVGEALLLDVVNAVDSQIEKVAEASEKLDVVRDLLNAREE